MANQPAGSEAMFWAGVEHAGRFFKGDADVNHTLRKLVAALAEANVPYAIVGAMALNEYGSRRVTTNVDVLLTANGLATFKAHWLGRGYVEKFPGSKGLRDTENDVAIHVLLAGEYPGDGKPKPIRFPDPAEVAIPGKTGAFVPLPRLLELELASGMSAPHRLKDLADVIELVRAIHCPRELGDELDASVRDKFYELWDAAQAVDPE
jgi:hypothetical protein